MKHAARLFCLAMGTRAAPFTGERNESFIALRFHKVGSTNFREALTQVLQPSYMEHETLAAYKAGGLARYALLIEAPLVLHTALSSSGFDSLKQLAVHGRSKGASCCLHRPAA